MQNSNEKSKECCDICMNSKFALKGKMKERFNGICGLACACHFEPQLIPLDRDEREEQPISPIVDNFLQESLDKKTESEEKKYCNGEPCHCFEDRLGLPTPNLIPESTEIEEWESVLDKFIKEWLPEYYKHLSDSDENAGERLRESIRNAISLHSQKLVSELKEKIEKMINSKRPICNNIENTPEFWINETLDDVVDLLNNIK